MKTLKWLVIVLACACPPCLWSACETETTEDGCAIDADYECLRFAQKLDDTRFFCSNSGNLSSDEQIDEDISFEILHDKCLETAERVCLPRETYDNCTNYQIECDTEKNELYVWGDCQVVIGMETINQ